MKLFLNFTILFFCCLSCKPKPEKPESNIITDPYLAFVTDTTNNRRAKWDLSDLKFRLKLEQQIGLKDLTSGANNLEIRLWYDNGYSSQALYTLWFQDTLCNLSYFRIFTKPYIYDYSNRNRNWNPRTDPIVDSSFSRSIRLNLKDYENLHLDSIWLLKTQSELHISDSFQVLDCDSYIIEIADKNRYKYLRHHCAQVYYEETQLSEILTYMDFCDRIIALVKKQNFKIPYNHYYYE